MGAHKGLMDIAKSYDKLLKGIVDDFGVTEEVAKTCIARAALWVNADPLYIDIECENEEIAQDCFKSNFFTTTDRYILIGSHLCPICQIRSEV